MKKVYWPSALAAVCIVAAWLVFRQDPENPYEGMSIIPEQHHDIPLFEGLKLDNPRYVMKGNHWVDVYDFYHHQLPENGWKMVYQHSALLDDDAQNDETGGFQSRWRKEGFEDELWIWGHYDPAEDSRKSLKSCVSLTALWTGMKNECLEGTQVL